MTSKNGKKVFARYDYSSTLNYCLADEDKDSRRAITINISLSGLCLYLYEPVAARQRIIIRNSVLPFANKEATVVWIKKAEIEEGIYKAGVEFCSAS
jgi:hypothetical protein